MIPLVRGQTARDHIECCAGTEGDRYEDKDWQGMDMGPKNLRQSTSELPAIYLVRKNKGFGRPSHYMSEAYTMMIRMPWFPASDEDRAKMSWDVRTSLLRNDGESEQYFPLDSLNFFEMKVKNSEDDDFYDITITVNGKLWMSKKALIPTMNANVKFYAGPSCACEYGWKRAGYPSESDLFKYDLGTQDPTDVVITNFKVSSLAEGEIAGKAVNPCEFENGGCDSVLAECSNDNGKAVCVCKRGTTGSDGLNCQDIDECAGDNDCDANAVCRNTAGSYECKCKAGFYGNGKMCKELSGDSFEMKKAIRAYPPKEIGGVKSLGQSWSLSFEMRFNDLPEDDLDPIAQWAQQNEWHKRKKMRDIFSILRAQSVEEECCAVNQGWHMGKHGCSVGPCSAGSMIPDVSFEVASVNSDEPYYPTTKHTTHSAASNSGKLKAGFHIFTRISLIFNENTEQ